MSNLYPYIGFKQYGSDSQADELVLFAAKAKDLYAWAGIPRKGWHIRMLFQRPITPTREVELKKFWQNASGAATGETPIVGPTAITVAIQDGIKVRDGMLDLTYTPEVNLLNPNLAELCADLAKQLWDRLIARLSQEQRELLTDRQDDPFAEFPPVDNDYVFEFALQLQQMIVDCDRFFADNAVTEASQREIVEAMEAILRPAIVVDGQHRLYGASLISQDVILPVVAVPHCPWTEQVYQFVVINEKAERVDTSLLSDIFGSSITLTEQREIRDRFRRLNVDIESRIAATIANREVGSPFRNMVVVKMTGTPPAGVRPYISERTIRALIDGSSQKHSLGWRADEEFYEHFVKPTFPNREDWDRWSGGKWQEYWFVFWRCIAEFYNTAASAIGQQPLWNPSEQTNLTKAVTLRQVQSLFMDTCVSMIKKIEENRETLVDMVGDVDLADAKIAEQKAAKAIPDDLEDFADLVRSEFLERGIPVKVFTATWKRSLDDPDGQDQLWEVLESAFTKSRKGEAFHVRGKIFEASVGGR